MQKKSFSTFIELKCSHSEDFGPPNELKLPPFLGLKYVTMKWGFYYNIIHSKR